MGAIYQIYNTITKQSYIGKSDEPYKRIKEHLMPLGLKGSREIQADLVSLPPESWQWKVIADEKDYPLVTLNDLERLFIDFHDTIGNGYNRVGGGGSRPCSDTQDETDLRKEMRDEIVRAISAYQEQHQERLRTNKGSGEIKLSALANQPDSVLIELINDGNFGLDVQNLEDLKGIIEEQQFLKEVDKACQQITDLVSSKADEILELFRPALDNIREDLRPYFFLQLSIQWDMKKAEDGEEVGSWSITPRVLTPFDYRNV